MRGREKGKREKEIERERVKLDWEREKERLSDNYSKQDS